MTRRLSEEHLKGFNLRVWESGQLYGRTSHYPYEEFVWKADEFDSFEVSTRGEFLVWRVIPVIDLNGDRRFQQAVVGQTAASMWQKYVLEPVDEQDEDRPADEFKSTTDAGWSEDKWGVTSTGALLDVIERAEPDKFDTPTEVKVTRAEGDDTDDEASINFMKEYGGKPANGPADWSPTSLEQTLTNIPGDVIRKALQDTGANPVLQPEDLSTEALADRLNSYDTYGPRRIESSAEQTRILPVVEAPEVPEVFANRCPTCSSRNPALHPAVGGGGEVTSLCTDEFHNAK